MKSFLSRLFFISLVALPFISYAQDGVNPSATTTAALPDVVVNIDKIDHTSIVYAAQPWTWITYTVINKGNASTNAPIFLHPVSNGSSTNMGYMKIDPLASGASITKTFAVGHDSLWPVGKYTVKLEADYDNTIAESNENNNVSNEQSFAVISDSSNATLNVTTVPAGASVTNIDTGFVYCASTPCNPLVVVPPNSVNIRISKSGYGNWTNLIYLYAGKTTNVNTTLQSTPSGMDCQSPYVEYQGKCVDPVPACENPPAHYMPSSCVDKIENGKRIPRYNFQCWEGYTRSGSECVKSATAPPKMSCGNSGGGSGLYSGCVGDTLSYYEGQAKALIEILAYDQSSVTVAIKKPDGSGSGTVLAKQEIQLGTSFKYGLGADTSSLADDAILVVTYKQVTDKHGAFIHVTSNQPATAATDTSCATPYVLYQGKCVDPIPACRNGIKNSISCIDKIENGKYFEHFYYSCLPGYEKRNDQCIGGSETNARPVTTPTAVRVPPSPTLDTGVSVGYEDDVVTAKAKNPFSDTDMNTLVGQAAAGLHALGIIGGYADGTFKGDRPVNRAEAAKFLLLSRYSSSALQEIRNEGKFWDVLDGQWYTRFILNAYLKGLMSGYPDGSMGPGKNVNTAEFLKMLSLNFALPLNLSYSYVDVTRDAWFAPYAGIAVKYNLFPERKGKLYPANELTRAEVAVALYQYLSKK